MRRYGLRRTYWRWGLLLCAVIAAFVLWRITWARPVLPDMRPEVICVSRVFYQGDEITDRIDKLALVQLLQETDCQYRWWKYYPKALDFYNADGRDRWMIDILMPGGSYMIILGEYNCYYSNGRAYEILNPARMEDQLLSSVIKN